MAKLTNGMAWKVVTVAVAAGETYSAEIDVREYGLLGVKLPATYTGTKLAVQACEQSGGTFATVYDKDGDPMAAATTSLGGKWVQFPFDAFPFPFIKLFFTDASDVAQAQAGGATFLVAMKS